MKILLTADPFIPVPPLHYGGIERIIDGLVFEFRKAGHTVGLIAHPESQCAVDTFFPWPASEDQPNWIHYSQSILRAARSFQPDVLHSFSRLSYLAPLMRTSFPKIMSYQRATGGWNISVFDQLIQNLHFAGCSEHICRQGRRGGGHWTPIHNFVELGAFDFVEQVPDDAPLVFLSRIEKIKGTHRAIQIARDAGKNLIIAGNQVNSQEGINYWNDFIEPQLDGEQIRYIGEVNDHEKNQLLGSACALLVPIEWDEPFGIVFAEALACGTPVISSPRGALPEIITSPKVGYLAPNNQKAVDIIRNLHTFNRKACREHASKYFSSEVIAKEYISLYRNLFSKL